MSETASAIAPRHIPRNRRIRFVDDLKDGTGEEIVIVIPQELRSALLGEQFAAIKPKASCGTCWGRGLQRHVKPGTNDTIEGTCNCVVRAIWIEARR